MALRIRGITKQNQGLFIIIPTYRTFPHSFSLFPYLHLKYAFLIPTPQPFLQVYSGPMRS